MGEPKHKDILLELKEVKIKDYYQLGICLDIGTVELDRIAHVNQHDTKKQLADIIDYWQKNSDDHSWRALATAIENVGGYKILARKLRDLDGSSKAKDKNTTEPTVTSTNQQRDTPTNNETTDTLSPGEDTDTSAPDPPAPGVETRLGNLETGLLVGGLMLAGAMLYEGVSTYQNRKRDRESETEDTDENSSKPKEKRPKKT